MKLKEITLTSMTLAVVVAFSIFGFRYLPTYEDFHSDEIELSFQRQTGEILSEMRDSVEAQLVRHPAILSKDGVVTLGDGTVSGFLEYGSLQDVELLLEGVYRDSMDAQLAIADYQKLRDRLSDVLVYLKIERGQYDVSVSP